MRFKIYRKREDYNFDEVYSFVPLGNSEKEYQTEITVDGLDMDIKERSNIVRLSCNCQFGYGTEVVGIGILEE